MILRTNHGTGDTYMTLAFAEALKQKTKETVWVSHPTNHNAIAAMFPNVPYCGPEAGGGMGLIMDCHPTTFSGDISRFALTGRPTTHADLWRAMLGLGLDEPMERGKYEHRQTIPNSVFMITEARSWPNHHPQFWTELNSALIDAGWVVVTNDYPRHSLADIFEFGSKCEWVIGPQCGVMAILCHAMFPCRKTICTPAVEGTGWIVPTTYPYARVETFAGEDYGDVEEVMITGITKHAIECIMEGPHFNRVPVENKILSGMKMWLSPGDFLDRLSILTLKVTRLPPAKAAVFQKEYRRYLDVFARIQTKGIVDCLCDLMRINGEAWENNDLAVPSALAYKPMQDHHAAAIRLNRERVLLKNKINEQLGSPIEIKSYYP